MEITTNNNKKSGYAKVSRFGITWYLSTDPWLNLNNDEDNDDHIDEAEEYSEREIQYDSDDVSNNYYSSYDRYNRTDNFVNVFLHISYPQNKYKANKILSPPLKLLNKIYLIQIKEAQCQI